MFDLSELVNILDRLEPPDIMTEQDYLNAFEVAGELIHDYVSGDYLKMAEPTFHSELYNDVHDELISQLSDAFTEDVEVELTNVLEEAIKLYFAHIVPRRSYLNSEVYGSLNIESMTQKLDYLTNVPQPDQRTQEWYQFRHKHLTASSIWKAFSSQSNINQLIYGKCAPLDVSKYSRVNLESPLHWGQKYEDVSIAWYENKYGTIVKDFGCIPHKKLKYLAASPDGINVDPCSQSMVACLKLKTLLIVILLEYQNTNTGFKCRFKWRSANYPNVTS